jgi:hypothetical protein
VKPSVRLQADFNGLFGDVLCSSHADACPDLGAHVNIDPPTSMTATVTVE